MPRAASLPTRLALGACMLCATAAAAEPDWSLCETPAAAPADGAVPDYRDLPVDLYADLARFGPEGGVLEGDVRFVQADRTLRAEHMEYVHEGGRVDAAGEVEYRDGGLRLSGERARIDTAEDRALFEQAEYRVPAAHARGSAERISREGQVTRLQAATYTTCDPGERGWEFRAGRLVLDAGRGEGRARNTTLRFQGVPVFYFPAINFPIDDRRRSGLLAPSVGNSSARGAELAIPYYWNIAPNYDATFTPAVMTERGFKLGSELRYLTRGSAGRLEADFVPDDRETGEQRYLAAVEHRTLLTPRLGAQLVASDVSDDDWFDDYGNSLALSSITHLERRADLRYEGGGWGFLGRAQGFQTIDPTIAPEDRPYQRLPQLLVTGERVRLAPALDLDLRGELVAFERQDSVSGQRLDLFPQLRAPLSGPWWFAEPMLGYRYTGYQLQDAAAGVDERPSRDLPVASLDSGLVLERMGRRGRVLTLEPRLFLLYVPFREQEDLPVFDTAAVSFGRTSLFLEDRFTGPDRVGDAEQATLALTTRLLDGGTERLRASLGQIYYGRDPRVTLPGEAPPAGSRSDWLADLRVRLAAGLDAGMELLWDPEREVTDKSAVDLRWRRGPRRLANLGYRYRRDDVEQVDASVFWPLARRWRGIGRWNYSLRQERDLETLLGVEYETCCWRLQLLGRDYITGAETSNTSFYVQLSLKGLADIGNEPETVLENGILGYRPVD